jgi:hypothetical protein
MINQCLLYRYIISYEPFNFKGMPEDYPLTLAYGEQTDALRAELREYFWDGEFRHEVGATVRAEGGTTHHPYAVFVSRQTGQAALAIANYDEKQTVRLTAALDDGRTLTRYRLVDDPEWHLTADGITLPPCTAAVVVP